MYATPAAADTARAVEQTLSNAMAITMMTGCHPVGQDAACRLGVHFLQRIFRNSLSESQSFVG